ncbi:MAG TPA: NAD(P)-dependent oxidoreductase [Allosphingosinicella sp.]|nr:NAD(P)-dependent oxidoreductase [Allosphingosinicella sp.]
MGKTLILGSGGMLGSAFVAAHGPNGLATAGRAQIKAQGVEAIVRAAEPNLVINCAAHTDVEGAERDPAEAIAANAVLPGKLGDACREGGALLVHISSTGCYGAWKSSPFVEIDRAEPTTVHHRSKLAGELAVRESGCNHLIVRTGWLFGGQPGAPKNFVWNRLVEASGTDRIVSDPFQRGCPTLVDDVARQIFSALAAGIHGLVNIVSGGSARRFDYVERIVRAARLPCAVEPAQTPFKRLAAVSPNEAAVNERLRAQGLDAMPTWEDAVDRYVATLIASRQWTAREVRT